MRKLELLEEKQNDLILSTVIEAPFVKHKFKQFTPLKAFYRIRYYPSTSMGDALNDFGFATKTSVASQPNEFQEFDENSLAPP